jgi:hypothetical protein
MEASAGIQGWQALGYFEIQTAAIAAGGQAVGVGARCKQMRRRRERRDDEKDEHQSLPLTCSAAMQALNRTTRGQSSVAPMLTRQRTPTNSTTVPLSPGASTDGAARSTLNNSCHQNPGKRTRQGLVR